MRCESGRSEVERREFVRRWSENGIVIAGCGRKGSSGSGEERLDGTGSIPLGRREGTALDVNGAQRNAGMGGKLGMVGSFGGLAGKMTGKGGRGRHARS